MAIVNYGGFGIIPGPLVSFAKNPIIAGNQDKLGSTYTITIQGQLTAGLGSPQGGSLNGGGWGGPLGKFWILSGYPPNEFSAYNNRLNNLLEKQEALRALFSTDGLWLEWQSADGSTPCKCQPKDFAVEFSQGLWVNTVEYTITCLTDILYVNGNPDQDVSFPELIQNADENWSIQPADIIKTFNVTHVVSAVGKRTFNTDGSETQPAWKNARDFVDKRLVLGWNGSSLYPTESTKNIFDASSLGSGVINFNSLSPYNFSRAESVDELGGSYGVTETWVAAVGSGTDTYNVSVNKTAKDPYTTVMIGIQGTLRGFYSNLFDYDVRMLSAEWMWSQLQGQPLFNRINSYLPSGITSLNQQPLEGALDYNPQEGTINYSYQYSNTLFNGDAFESYTVSRKSSIDDYKSVFGINGQIRGRRYETDTDPTISFQRAYSLWNQIYVNTSGAIPNNPATLFGRVISNTYFPEASGLGLQLDPIDKSIDMNQSEGIISYSFSWNNRYNPSGVNNDGVEEEFTIESNFNREDGVTHYVINGTVKGLNITDRNPQISKYAQASGYFYNIVEPNLYSRVSNYYGISLPNQLFQSKEISLHPIAGMITYNYGFNSLFPPLLPGALSEVITVSQTNPSGQVNVIAQIPIIGRPQGLILQDMSTTEVKTRTLSIEVVLSPTGSLTNLLDAFNTKPDYSSYALQLKPVNSYTTSNSESYDWRRGRYSLNVSWLFE